ncbi:MAG: alpha/beta hydrolase [Alphaproteobacteria bacterium]|nr:alpha/beta hydrolase [Alphaproteobacteria bacterium]
MMMPDILPRPLARWTIASAVALGMAAAANVLLARKAERQRPPMGRFLHVNGEELHVVDRGEGKVLVLLHGNGSSVDDFAVSGLIERGARKHRVIAIDRPGFGHSPRSARGLMQPEEQADLIAATLSKLGVEHAVIFGHSWGTLVALALAQRHPDLVAALVLASGYYFPTPRPDVLPFSLPALPVAGDALCYTVWPLLSRFTWAPLMRQLFGPAPVSRKLSRCLKPLALRPKQLRATGQETAAMIPAAKRLSAEYGHIRAPVTIVAGEGDRIVSPEQARRLQAELRIASLHVVPDTGHMVHHSAPEEVFSWIERSMIHAAAA